MFSVIVVIVCSFTAEICSSWKWWMTDITLITWWWLDSTSNNLMTWWVDGASIAWLLHTSVWWWWWSPSPSYIMCRYPSHIRKSMPFISAYMEYFAYCIATRIVVQVDLLLLNYQSAVPTKNVCYPIVVYKPEISQILKTAAFISLHHQSKEHRILF